jgi:streptogramin lyase
MAQTLRKITAASLCVLLASCGGGGDSDSSSAYFNTPTDITIDGAGNLFVMDNGNQMIRKISPTGEVTLVPGNYEQFSQIVADASGNLYVSSSGEFYKITPGGNRTTLTSLPTSPGMYGGRTSSGFSMDAQGNLYALFSAMRWAVIRVDPNGISREVSSGSSVPTLISALASDAHGNLALGWSIEEVDQSGLYLMPRLADGSYKETRETVPLQHQNIEDMVYDAAGNLYLLDARFNWGSANQDDDDVTTLSEIRVIRFAPDGTATTLFSGLPNPQATNRQSGYHRMGITVGADGTVYFSDSTDHAIYRLGANGEAILVAGKSGEAGNSN